VQVGNEASGFLFVPGWTFLGASFDAVIVQPFIIADVGSPLDVQQSGVHNTYIVPVELSWKFGDSGFFAKAGLGIYTPDGSISGANGLSNVGNPWWTFEPEFIVSYLKNGWNFTANLFEEINAKNSITGYTSGDILHAELTATKTVGKWTVGPVAYYVGQVTNDTSSAFYRGAINVNNYDIWAAGGLLGYNFGPVQLYVWALDEFSAHASGGSIQFQDRIPRQLQRATLFLLSSTIDSGHRTIRPLRKALCFTNNIVPRFDLAARQSSSYFM
jgi:hypothetical protein